MPKRRGKSGLKNFVGRALERGARWALLLVALYAIALALPRLPFWPGHWQIPVSDGIKKVTGIADEAVVCIALASAVISYLSAREGRATARDLVKIAGFVSGLPWVTTISGWMIKGAVIVFKTLRRKVEDVIREEARAEARAELREEVHAEVREEVRAEGRVEESAKWRSWLERRLEANPDLLDENDPPPEPPKQ